MPLLSSSIPNLVNGVSQQAPALRLSSHLEAQENAYSSVVEGLGKRSNTNHIKRLTTANRTGSLVHTINRSTDERYEVILRDGGIEVFDLVTGDLKTINAPDGLGYLNTSGTAKAALKALTVEDYTFVVNTERTVAMLADLSTDDGVRGLVFIKQGQYSTTYKITVNGSEVATYTTSGSDVTDIQTTNIADELADQADTALGAGWAVTLKDSTILITKDDGSDFTLSVTDSFGDRAMTAVKDAIQRFSDLPTVAPTGFRVEILGDNLEKADNYWVKFVPNNPALAFDKGNWVETVAPGITYKLDPSTMPHILVRESNGTFTFSEATWAARDAGDADTNPNPSFVGDTVNEVFFFKNRLGLLSGANTIMSVAGGFFGFFSETVTTILDSDPIDVSCPSTKESKLLRAVPFREQLLLFTKAAQYVLNSGNILTPNSVSIDPATDFACSLLASPVGAGNNVYFAFPRGPYAGVREYFVQQDGVSKDAADITSHVPRYLKGNITSLTAATNEDILVATADGETNALYVYKYYWVNDQKLQSSWSKFLFEDGCEVLNVDFVESKLYVTVQRTDGCHLESMEFAPGLTDTDSEFVTLLDRRLTEADTTVAYDSVDNSTTWTLPYDVTGEMQVVVRAGDSSLPEGRNITLTAQEDNILTATGDYSDTLVYIGQKYLMSVTLSEQVLREEAKGGGQSSILAGRIQMRYYTVGYNDTGYFEASATPTGRDASTKVFTGFTLGVSSPGTLTLPSGKFRFPIFAQSNEVTVKLTSDSFLPCHFTALEYECHYTSRSQRA